MIQPGFSFLMRARSSQAVPNASQHEPSFRPGQPTNRGGLPAGARQQPTCGGRPSWAQDPSPVRLRPIHPWISYYEKALPKLQEGVCPARSKLCTRGSLPGLTDDYPIMIP